MTIEKLVYPSKQNAVQEKINEIIDYKQDKLTSANAGTDIQIIEESSTEVTEFETGINSITLTSAKANSLDYVKAYGACEQRNLPSGYTEYDSLIGDGTAYIDLNCTLTQDDEIELEFTKNENVVSKDIFGARTSASSQNISVILAGTGNVVEDFNNSDYTDYRLNTEVSLNTRYKVVMNKTGRYLYQGDTLVASNTTACPDTITTVGCYLFNLAGTGLSNRFTGIIHRCLIKGKRDVVPCGNGTAYGMYDKLNGVFYPNANTEGSFTVGNATVPTPEMPMDIVCNNGVLKAGINEFDENAITSGYFYNADLEWVANPSVYITDYMKTVKGKYTLVLSNVLILTTTVNIRVNLFNANKEIQSQVVIPIAPDATEYTYEVDIPDGISYVRISTNPTYILVDGFNNSKTIYTDGTTETVTDSLDNTATAEMLLKVGDYSDEQSVLDGTVTRNVKAIVLNGTEPWAPSQTYSNVYTAGIAIGKPSGGIVPICNYYAGYSSYVSMTANDYGILGASTATIAIKNKDCVDVTAFTTWLADQYNAGTPVIIVYPLATATTETVTGQTLTTKSGDNTITATGSVSSLPLKAQYTKITTTSALTISFINNTGYTTNVGTVTKVNNVFPDSNGNVTLSIPSVDQTYSSSSTNAQSGTAVAGALSNYVTLSTNQDITGTKTYVGQKKIEFKQSTSTDKLGFTLYDTSNNELGAFEYRPNTISTGALLNINAHISSSDYVGFRYWGTSGENTINIIAPKPTTSGNYYIPTQITNGTGTTTANNNGVININPLMPDLSTKQDTLVSGTNIKTINNESILGSGNITIQGGGTVDQVYDGTSANAQSGVAIEGELTSNYQHKLIAGTNITLLDTDIDANKWTTPTLNSDIDLSEHWFPSEKLWICGAYGNGVFSIGGDANWASYSTDGINWAPKEREDTVFYQEGAVRDIIYDGTKFVAIASYGIIFTCTDGAWLYDTSTEYTGIGSGTNWVALAYDGRNYVALSTDGYISTSTDLQTWSTPAEVSGLGSNSWKSLIYAEGKFVALSSTGYISTSTDGTTWTTATQDSELSSYTWVDIVYTGKLVALSSTGYISTSTNGTTWTEAEQATALSGTSNWVVLLCGDSKCIAINEDGYISNTILTRTQISTIPTIAYGTSNSAATDVTKTVSIPEITTLKVGQMIVIQPSVTSTVASSEIKLNDFPAYSMRYNNSAITTSSDSIVWNSAFPSTWVFDGTYWVFAGHGLDSNTTYSMAYLMDAGIYKAGGSDTYAISRYSLILEKPDGTWEKPTATDAKYSTATTKTVNTNGFILNQIKYYGTTTTVSGGNFTAASVVYDKSNTFSLAYSTNCGTAPAWTAGMYVYLVGTIGSDGLFYLDTTTWWSVALPSTNDGKVYIQIGKVISNDLPNVTLEMDRPVFYHDGTGVKEYSPAITKQDILVSGTNIKTINNESILGSGNISISSGASALSGLSDVTITSASDGQVLSYDNATSKWINSTLPTASASTLGIVKPDGSSITIDSNGVISSAITDVQVDGVSVVNSGVANIIGKQDTLVSGTNIKTINSTSLLGSGNVSVQETLVSGTNIKTINSASLLGSGNISVQETLVSGTNIKTINSTSLLGNGDIEVLQNKATKSSSLSIGGYGSIYNNATNVGMYSNATDTQATALGRNATASANFALSLGAYSTASATNAIQIGYGTNSTASTLAIGFNNTSYQLLDGTTGLIPNARLSTLVGADGTNAGTAGIVPAPTATDNTKFLKGDGTWATVTAPSPTYDSTNERITWA